MCLVDWCGLHKTQEPQIRAPALVPSNHSGSPSTFPWLGFPSWEVGLEMLASAHGALRPQVYCQVSDTHGMFISSGFRGTLEHSKTRSRHSRGAYAWLVCLAKVTSSHGLTVAQEEMMAH